MIAVLFTAYSMSELARHLPSAGGMYTYVGRGLGSFFGWMVAWSFAFAEPLIMPILLGGFGFYGAIFLSTYLSIEFEMAWIVLALVCAALVWFLNYRGIALSTRTGVALGVIEIGIFLLISSLLIINAEENTLSVFVPGDEGVLPAFQGMIFCLLAFIGFEAAAPLGEETAEPRSTIPKAVIWSAVLVGLFYVFNMYAATVYFGPENMTDFLAANDGDPWGGMATEVMGTLGGLLVIFAILNSCVANANSSATAATRTWFAMGRVSLLPRFFAAVSPETRAPVNAVHVQAVLAIVVAIGLGLVLTDDPIEGAPGLNVYIWLGTLVGLLFAAIYILVNLACIGYFLREGRSEFNPIKHVVVPILGVIAMIPAVLAVIGGVTIPILDIELAPYENSLRYTAPVVGVWVVLGLVVYFALRMRNPAALDRVDDVYGGDDAPSEDSDRLTDAGRRSPAGPTPTRRCPAGSTQSRRSSARPRSR